MDRSLSTFAESDTILAAFFANVDALFQLVGFDALSGSRTIGATPLDIPITAGRAHGLEARIAAVTTGRATSYTSERDIVGDVEAIRRLRVDTTGASPFVIDSVDVTTDINIGGGWEVLSTAVADYLVYQNAAGDLTLSVGPSGDAPGTFRVAGTVASGGEGQPFDVALAVRDPLAPVSTANPLGIAWQRLQPAGTAFVEVTNVTVFAAGPPSEMTGSVGAFRSYRDPTRIVLVATDSPDAGHWLVASVEHDRAMGSGTGLGTVELREISRGGRDQRQLTLTGESLVVHSQIGTERSGRSLRLLTRGSAGGLVTRAIGCE